MRAAAPAARRPGAHRRGGRHARWVRHRQTSTGDERLTVTVAGRGPQVHQVVPALLPGDALGRLALDFRDRLRELGCTSEIFAEARAPAVAAEARPLDDLVTTPADGVLYHLAIASRAEALVLGLPARRAVVYHNLTPGRWFRGLSRRTYDRVVAARRRLPVLAQGVELGIALSEYSRAELVAAGFPRTVICPPAVAPGPPSSPAERQEHLVLGVGRIAPHKRWELAVRAMAALRRELPTARLEIVGSDTEMEAYAAAVRRLAARLNAGVRFLGGVDDPSLEAAFARASALVHPSAHEGLGLPLLEAMARGVPVVATARAAVPETVGDAGLLCRDDPLELAAALHRILTDGRVRRHLVERGRRRAAHFDEAAMRRHLAAALAPWGVGE